MTRTRTPLNLLMMVLIAGACSTSYGSRARLTGFPGAAPASHDTAFASALPAPGDLELQVGTINRALYVPQLLSFRSVVESLAPELEVHRVSAGVLGRTLVWDPEHAAYAPGIGSDAPAGAIRVTLYGIESATGRPAMPLVVIGAIDLYPRNTSVGNPNSRPNMRYVVSGVGADPPRYADFTVVQGDPECVCATAAGWVTDGVTRFDFSMPYAVDAERGAQFTATARAASQRFELHFDATLEESLLHSAVRFRFRGDSLEARGTLRDGDDSIPEGTFAVFVNGRAFSEGNGDLSATVGPQLRALTAVEVMAHRQLYALTYGLLINIAIPAYLTFNCGC
jgi:hypothetical protein